VTGRHHIWDAGGVGGSSVEVPVHGGENVMVPVIRAVVRPVGDESRILLQRRDDPSESVRGMLEIPGGRWRSGESPIDAIVREVSEESGVTILTVHGTDIERLDSQRAMASINPLLVVAGLEGDYPAVHIVLVADGEGVPHSAPGETADGRWWSLAEVTTRMHSDPDDFIPSTRAALRAYVAWLGSIDSAIVSS
jgi:8-oxo-dGTP pyrophosphatase MutT (NUDIX family)